MSIVLYYQQFTNITEIVQVWKLGSGCEKLSKSKQVPTQNQELCQAFDLVAPEATKVLQPVRFSQVKKQLLV